MKMSLEIVARALMRNIFFVGVVAGLAALMSACGGDSPTAKGKVLYAYYCTPCHGTKGDGNGFNAVNLDPKPRDHTDGSEPYMAGRTNDELFEAVTKGGAGVSKSPFMPPFGAVLSDAERWSLVAYLRTLHKNDAPAVVIPPDASTERPKFPSIQKAVLELSVGPNEDGTPGDIEEARQRQIQIGERNFSKKYGCLACHRVGGAGGQVGPPLDRVGFRLRPDYIYRWIKNPQAIKPDTKMPNFQLRDKDAVAITYFLGTLQAPPEKRPEPKK